jgi:hypothetical protein
MMRTVTSACAVMALCLGTAVWAGQIATVSTTATPCTCIPLNAAHVGAELKEATLVFVGRVRAIAPIAGPETGPRERHRVILEVTRRWKGPEEPAYGVTAGPISPADLCVAKFESGETYLVFAFGDHVASCRAWKQGGPPPFASVGSIADMNTVMKELDRLTGRTPSERPETLDVPHLFGIASLVVVGNSIEVTQDETLPRGLELRTTTRGSKATVKVGESFAITDGHHYGYTYKLLALEKGIAEIEMTPWTAFLGEKPTQSTSTIHVRSYRTRRKP